MGSATASSEAFELAWEDFERIHVISRVREIMHQWWGVQLNFVDMQGRIRGVPAGRFFSPQNAMCREILARQEGFEGCRRSVREACQRYQGALPEGYKVTECHAGLRMLVVPIRRPDGVQLGSILIDGFRLAEDQVLEEAVPQLSHEDLSYIVRLTGVLVEEALLVSGQMKSLEFELKALQPGAYKELRFPGIVGQCPKMQGVFDLMEAVSSSDVSVFINGENGTGKERVAHAIHARSSRKRGRFVALNCAAFNDSLLESELFGHVKGAFTGASQDKPGLFEVADRGTLFLDELGDMSLVMQVKLLRVLQEGQFFPVGATKEKHTNARVVCATNKDLTKLVQEGKFREDLYYRLVVVEIHLPPLRERQEDMLLLIEHFRQTMERKMKCRKELTSDAVEAMLSYSWPGNIREMQNEMERLFVLSGSQPLIPRELLSEKIHSVSQPRRESEVAGPEQQSVLEGKVSLKSHMEALEAEYISRCLDQHGGNRTAAAKVLGVSRANLIAKIAKYKLGGGG